MIIRVVSSLEDLWDNVNDDVNHCWIANAGEVRVSRIQDFKGDITRQVYLLIFPKWYIIDHLDPKSFHSRALCRIQQREIPNHAQPKASNGFDEDSIPYAF